MGALQSDVVSLLARRLQPLLQAALAARGDSVPATTRGAADLLLHWDGALLESSAPAALYELWIRELNPLVMEQRVPPAARSIIPPWSTPRVVGELEQLSTGSYPFLLSALGKARERLRVLQGDDPGKWSWGALHQVMFRHALDAVPGGASLFDLGPFPRSGDDYVVQATSGDHGTLEQSAGASYREIFDLSDWDKSAAVNVPGQSGQPGSPHYDDLLPLWRTGGYFQLAYSRKAVDAVTTDVLEMKPAGNPGR
jgi:penicillin amidase